MKKILVYIFIIAIITSCENNTKPENKKTVKESVKESEKEKVAVADPNVFGENIEFTNTADVYRLPTLMNNTNELEIKLVGVVSDVCQSSGCWFELELDNGKSIHVTIKDESFVVPKDIAGKRVLIKGIAKKELLSVDMQKKIAIDEGRSQNEIDAIKSAEPEYSFETVGVVIK
jgi:uncharacterized protein DUF4920